MFRDIFDNILQYITVVFHQNFLFHFVIYFEYFTMFFNYFQKCVQKYFTNYDVK